MSTFPFLQLTATVLLFLKQQSGLFSLLGCRQQIFALESSRSSAFVTPNHDLPSDFTMAKSHIGLLSLHRTAQWY